MKHTAGSNPRNFRALHHILPVILLTCSVAFSILPSPDPAYAASAIERVSISSDGVEGDALSWQETSISDDGRYVAFASYATNLVTGDTNGWNDIFVRDRQAGTTTRVSIDSDGVQVNGSSRNPSISGDGRYVAFVSEASNLVAGDNNTWQDVFVHDRQTGATTRVSVDSAGVQGNNESYNPSISSDGRYVAFDSWASNLVAGDNNSCTDIFVRDRTLGTTTRVSVDSAGTQGNSDSVGPSISGDGRYVAFLSGATNLVDVDTGGYSDIFVRDRTLNTTTMVSVDSAGAQGNGNSDTPSISGGGRYVAFRSLANNLVAGDATGFWDIFVRDRTDNTTTMVSLSYSGAQGNSNSANPSISGDGRYVAFDSDAFNLVAVDTNSFTDIFVRDRTDNTTTRLSVASGGDQGLGNSVCPAISGDGRYVAFKSSASNLVASDYNLCDDIFVAGPCTKPGAPTLALPAGGACLTGASGNFTWAAGTYSPTKYVLQVSANPAFTGTNIHYADVGNTTSHLVTGLPNNGSALYWRVLSGNAACGWGAWSARRGFYNGKPGSPTLSTPSAGAHVASTSATFTWAAGTGTPANYFLQVSTDPLWVGPNMHYAMVSGTSHGVSGFPNDGTVYYWRVTAGNTCGWSPWSARRAIVNGP